MAEDIVKLIERIRMNGQMCHRAVQHPVSDLRQIVEPIRLLAEDAVKATAEIVRLRAALNAISRLASPTSPIGEIVGRALKETKHVG